MTASSTPPSSPTPSTSPTSPTPSTPRAPKAAEQIAGVLRTEIVTGVVADGERLGSGPELFERFGVSRPTMREAFRILEAEQLIEIERGVHGGVVARRPSERHTLRAVATVLESRGVTLADVYEARTLIEPVAARRIAESRSRRSKVRKLERFVDRQEEVINDAVAYAAANVAFHEELVAAGGNQTLVLLAEVLHELVSDAVSSLTAKHSDASGQQHRRNGVKSQRQLLGLIEAGDGEAAETYWRRHMEIVGKIMLADGTVVDHTASD